MKLKFSIFLALSLLLQPVANAASFTVVKSNFDLPYTGNEQVSDLLLTKSAISIIGTTEAATSTWIAGTLGGTSDGFISTFSNSGVPLWNLRLGNTNNEIATTAALDSDGSIWIAGASSVAGGKTPSPTPSKLLNPDNVQLSQLPVNSSLTKLNLWQVSASGQLLNAFETQTAGVIIPQKILVTPNGIALFGDIYEKATVKGFFASISKAGEFVPLIKYGVKQTQLSGAISNADGSFTVVGKSADLLLKIKPLSKVDAVSLKISAIGILQQVARATLKSTTRSWDSISAGMLQGGLVKYAKKSEAAVTKFSALGKPIWNDRYPANSPAFVVAGNNSWATFVSTGVIAGVTSWKPKVATPVVLELGKKGEVISAFAITGIPVAISQNNEIGTVVITDSGTSFGIVLIN
ncbi:MAG: hypothetical protein EBS18_00240 [Actinobacteria bacterium]|nr:hypothetical protein [Actinomycetota bacterium]